MNPSLFIRNHKQTRLLLVVIIAVMLVFSAYSAEFSHAYAAKKPGYLSEKTKQKNFKSVKKQQTTKGPKEHTRK